MAIPPDMKKSRGSKLTWLWLSAGVLLIDQVTKFLAARYLELYSPVSVVTLFDLTLMHNKGAAFSFLHDASGWQRWFFTALALAVSVAIVLWLRQLPPKSVWLPIALSLIVGGALGNAVDRVIHGYVIDFIDLYYQTWHWPAFNVADSAITIGAVMLLIDMIRQHGHDPG